MKHLFDRIAEVHQQTQGWCSHEKAVALVSMVIALRPSLVVEIGVFHGKSFLPMAMALQRVNSGGKAIAIDPWNASDSVQGQDNPADKEWWARQEIHEEAFRRFESAVERLGLSSIVTVIRQNSDTVAPPSDIGILSIDGNHGPQSLRDAQRFAPMVKSGGFVVMDDLKWTGGNVQRAVDWLLFNGFAELYRVENGAEQWAVFQKL